MYILYIDESGTTGTLSSATDTEQPVLVVGGIAIRQDKLKQVVDELLHLKSRFFPGLFGNTTHYLDRMLIEIKGSELRRMARDPGRRRRNVAFGFIDQMINVLVNLDAKVFARILVKAIGHQNDGRAIYTSYVQALCTYFCGMLHHENDTGFAILDSRNQTLNAQVSHSIFTRKFGHNQDLVPNLLEMPSFGHSDNHAGLQLADLLCSALLFPISACTYCDGFVNNVHVQTRHHELRRRYCAQMKSLQYRYLNANGKWEGGIVVCDSLNHQSTTAIFRP